MPTTKKFLSPAQMGRLKRIGAACKANGTDRCTNAQAGYPFYPMQKALHDKGVVIMVEETRKWPNGIDGFVITDLGRKILERAR